MTISFLIGNGFDVNLGLNTTFSSFLDCYTKENANDTEMIERFKKSILKDKKRWSDAEIAFGEYTEIFKREGKSADDYYECYDDFCEHLANYLLSGNCSSVNANLCCSNTTPENFANKIRKNYQLEH